MQYHQITAKKEGKKNNKQTRNEQQSSKVQFLMLARHHRDWYLKEIVLLENSDRNPLLAGFW